MTLTSTGAIDDQDADDSTTDITADDIIISATNGIGSTRAIEIEAPTVSNITASGDVNIDSNLGALVTYTNVTTDGGTLTLNASDGLNLDGALSTVDSVGADAGDMFFNADSDADGGVFRFVSGATLSTNDTGTDGNISFTASSFVFDDGAADAADIDNDTGTISFIYSQVGSLCLGTITGCTNDVPQVTLDLFASLAGGNLSLSADTDIFAEDVTLTGVNLTLEAGTGGVTGAIDDTDAVGVGPSTAIIANSLTMTSIEAIGGASANADGFTVDVGSLIVTDTGGTDVTITDTGTSDTVYDILTGGAGTVTVTQTANDLFIANNVNGITTTGNVVLSATTGNIESVGTTGVIAGAGISLTATAGTIGTSAASPLLIDYTAGNTLSLTTGGAAGAGSIWVDETNGTLQTADLTMSTAGGVQTVVISNSDADIDVNGAVAFGDDNVTLDAATVIDASIAVDGADDLVTTGTLSLIAGAGGIGATNAVEFEAGTINADTTNDGGNISLMTTTASDVLPGLITTGGAGDVTLAVDGAVNLGFMVGGIDGVAEVIANRLTVTMTSGGTINWLETDVTSISASTDAGSLGMVFREIDATTADGLTQHGTLSTEGGTIGLIIEEGGFNNAGFTIEIEDSTQANASSTILIDNTGLFADVSANAAGGDIVLSGTINADGADGTADVAGFNAGSVTLNAADGVDTSGATITAIGGNGGADSVADALGTDGGAGGAVDIDANNGAVNVGAVDTSGGDAAGNAAADLASGGAAGSINVDSTAGADITLSGTLVARGGDDNPTGTTGADGTVTINSAGSVVDNNDPGGADPGNVWSTNLDINAGSLSITAAGSVGTITDFAAGLGNDLEVALVDNLSVITSVAGGDINIDVGSATPAGVVTLNPGGANNANAIIQSTTGALTVNTGLITANSGDGIGFIAGTILTIPDEGGPLNLPGVDLLLSGGTDIVDAGGGDLNTRTLSITADTLGFQSGGAGGLTTLNTTITSLTASITTAGSGLTVNETNNLNLTDVTTNNGNITASVVGAAGDFYVGLVDAGTANVKLDVDNGGGAGWIQELAVVDAAADIVAGSIELIAIDGIGSSGTLEIDATNLAATSVSRGIFIEDTAGGVTVTTVGATTGISLTGSATTTESINLTATGGSLLLDADVTNNRGGDITLVATGTNSDVVIGNAAASFVTSSSLAATTSLVTITADDSVIFGDSSAITDSGAAVADVTITANNDTAAAGGGSLINMANCTTCFGINVGGKINLSTAGTNGGDITITRLITTSAISDAVTITSNAGVIDGTDDGLNIDAATGGVVINAVTGVGSAASPGLDVVADAALETNVASIDIVNATSGAIQIVETNGLTVTNATQTTDDAANDITIISNSGDILLAGAVDAKTLGDVTLTATLGAINEDSTGDATVNILGALATLTAQDEIGGAGELDIETTVGSLNASSTTSGNIVITETNAITLTDVDTQSGAITIVAGGAVTATDVVSITSLEANDIDITGVGIDVGVITATGVGDVSLDAGTGAITDGNGGTNNITAQDLDMQATTGVGSADQLETIVSRLNIYNATSGSINVTNTTNALTIDDFAGISLSGYGIENNSVTITDGVTIINNNSISLPGTSGSGIDAAGPITVTATGGTSDITTGGSVTGFNSTAASINLTAGQDITLGSFATGYADTLAGDDIIVIAGRNVSVGNDTVFAATNLADIDAGGNFELLNTAAITADIADITTTNGSILLNAAPGFGGDGISATTSVTLTSGGGAADNITLTDGDITTATLIMTSADDIGQTNSIITVTGDTTLTANAASDISLTNASNDFGSVAGDVTVVSGNNVLLDDANDLTVNTIAASAAVTLDVGGGVIDGNAVGTDISGTTLTIDSSDGVGVGDALEVAVTGIDIDNDSAGDVLIDNTQAGATTIISLTTVGSNINYNQTSGGDVGVTGTISSGTGGTDGGDITVTVDGALSFAALSGVSSLDGSGGTLTIGDGVSFAALSTIDVGLGNILLNGTDGADQDIIIGAAITMDGTLDLTASRDIIISAALTTNLATSDITLDADNDGDQDGGVWIKSTGTVDAGQNVVMNGSDIFDVTATTDVGIQIDGAVAAGGGGTGTITLTKQTAGSTAPTTMDIEVNDTLTSIGDVTIQANDDIIFGAAGAVGSGGGNVAITADFDTGGTGTDGAVTMTNGAVINAGTGMIVVDAAESITVGQLISTNNAINLTSTSGGVVDGGDAIGEDIQTAGTLTIISDTGVGSGSLAIETNVGTVDISNGSAGSVEIIETNNLALDQIANGTRAVNISSGGAITDFGDGNTDIVGGAVTVSSVNGFGSGDAIETDITSIDITNSTLNDIEITENDDITVVDATQTTNSDTNDITFISDTGDIFVTNIDAKTLGDVTLDSTAGQVDGSGGATISAGDLDIDAETGIGAGTALNVSNAVLINADTAGGDIDINNVASAAVIVNTMTTAGAATIDYDQSNNQTLQLDLVSTTNGDITINNIGGTGADVTIADGGVAADTTDDTVLINSTGAIDDEQANTNTTTDITAFTVDLDAAEGIGDTADVDLASQDISADSTTSGDIIINNISTLDVTVTSLTTTLGGNIIFNQRGTVTAIPPLPSSDSGVPTFNLVTTDGAGTITLNAEEGININGDLTTAGGVINIDAEFTETPLGANGGLFDFQTGSTMTTAGGDVSIRASDFDFDGTFDLTVGGALTLTFSQNKPLCLGTATACAPAGVSPGVTLDQTDLDSLATLGALTLSSGSTVLTEAATFDADLTLNNITSFDDTDDNDNYISNGTLTVNSDSTIGLNDTAGSGGTEGVNLDVVGFIANTTDDNVTVTDSGNNNGDTTYAMTTGAGDVVITQVTNNLIFNNITTTGGDVTLTAEAGAITDATPADDTTLGTEVNIVAHDITLVGDSIGGAGVADLDITLLTDGILNADTATNGGGDIFIHSTGNMVLGLVDADTGNNVTLNADGSVTDTNGTGLNIRADALVVDAVGGIDTDASAASLM